MTFSNGLVATLFRSARGRFRKCLCAGGALLMAAAAVGPVAIAQDAAPAPDRRPPASKAAGQSRNDPPGKSTTNPGRPARPNAKRSMDEFGIFGLAQLEPEDRGPVRDELERDQLLAFAGEKFPRVARLLSRAQKARPVEFERRLNEMAPRLRQIRRVYSENPKLGDLFRDMTQNFWELRPLIREARSLPADAPRRNELLAKIRPVVAENIQLECDALVERADSFDRRRGAVATRRFNAFVDPATSLNDVPIEFADLVVRFRKETDPAAKARIEADLRQSLDDFLDEEIALMRERAARKRAAGDDEVNARIRILLEPPGGDRP